MRSVLLSILCLTAGLAGCLGDGVGGLNEDGSSCIQGEINRDRDGTVTPTGPLWIEADAPAGPVDVELSVVTQGSGSLEVVLERDGEEIFSDQNTGVGNYETNWGETGHEPGTFNLSASTSAGAHDVTMDLSLAWSRDCTP